MLSFLKRLTGKIMTPSDKVKVTIALTVNSDGQWHAVGDDEWNHPAALEEAAGRVDCYGVTQTYYIVLEVPRPKVLTIELPSPEPRLQNVTGFVAEVKG